MSFPRPEVESYLNFSNRNNDTALDLAMEKQMWKVAGTLLRSGADPKRGNRKAEKYMYKVVGDNQLDLLELLLQKGCNPNAVDPDKNTVLDIAIENRSIDIISVLLKYDADPELGNISFVKFLFCMARKEPGEVEQFVKTSLISNVSETCWEKLLLFAFKHYENKEEYAEQCCKHIVKCGLLDKDDWCMPSVIKSSEISLFWNESKLELLKMKHHVFGGEVTMAFYMRRKTIDELASLVKTIGYISSPTEFIEKIRKEYKIYDDLIHLKVTQGMNRYYWLNLFGIVMKHSDFNKLNFDFVKEVTRYLSNEDMKNVVLYFRKKITVKQKQGKSVECGTMA